LCKIEIMIQRIQSVLLALAALMGVVFSFVPILGYQYQDKTYTMKAYQSFLTEDGSLVFKNMGIGFIGGIIIVLLLATIFLFKNRGLQMKLAKFSILLITLQIVAVVFYNDALKVKLAGEQIDQVVVGFDFGAILPVLTFLLTYLAIRFIKKDEKLVKAADRLR